MPLFAGGGLVCHLISRLTLTKRTIKSFCSQPGGDRCSPYSSSIPMFFVRPCMLVTAADDRQTDSSDLSENMTAILFYDAVFFLKSKANAELLQKQQARQLAQQQQQHQEQRNREHLLEQSQQQQQVMNEYQHGYHKTNMYCSYHTRGILFLDKKPPLL